MSADGCVYKGGLVDSKRHGIGVMNWADGSAYEGEWLYDNRHGQGHFIWANGDVYPTRLGKVVLTSELTMKSWECQLVNSHGSLSH